jgi:hypothetical protein
MNRKELITSIRASQLQSFKENRGLIPEFYGGGFGFSTSPEEQQRQNIEKRKKELEAKQIEQTGKKIEYQEPIPSSPSQSNQGTGPTPEVKVATDNLTPEERREGSAQLAAAKLDQLGDYYSRMVQAGKMTGPEAAKQIKSAADQYQAREDEKFTQDMLKQGEEAAWTGADISGTALSFASGVGAPAAIASTTSKLARAGQGIRRGINAAGPLTGAAVDLATAGTAKLNQATTTDKDEQQKYSDIATNAGLRAGATTLAVGGFKALPYVGQAVGKVASPVTPKVIKEPVKKAVEVTGKALDKTFSGNEPSQIAGGLIGYKLGSETGGILGGLGGGIAGTILGGKAGQLATKVAPVLNKNVRDIMPRIPMIR